MYDALDSISRECFRSFAALPDAELIDAHGAFGVVNDTLLTFFNGIATSRSPSVPAVIDIFRRRGRAFRWWVRDGAGAEELLAHGMRFGWDSAGMVADLRDGRSQMADGRSDAFASAVCHLPSAIPELRIVQVRDLEAMRDWALALTTVFDRPAADREKWLAGFGPLGFDGNWAHFVGYVEEAPMATTSVLVAGDVAGIYHVGTRKEARGRGIGSAVTRAALQYARARGAKEAALQSSEMAVSVYRGLGFVERATMSMYDWAP